MEKILFISFATLMALGASEAETQIVPRVGKICYQCTGIECFRAAVVNQTATCSDIMDYCATVFEESTIVARGCYAELPEEFKLTCENSPTACERCSSDLCNAYAHRDVRCAQCDSSTDERCLQTPITRRCPFIPAYKAFCYIQYSAPKTVRGCAPSLRDQINCIDDENCLLCGEMNCNTIAFPFGRRYCYSCSGEHCSVQNATFTLCNKLDDQCVSMVDGDSIVKGCLGSLTEAQKNACTGNTCLKCDSSGCNTIDVEKPHAEKPQSNAISRVHLSFSMLFLAIVLMGVH